MKKQKTIYLLEAKNLKKLLYTGYICAGVITGWLLGSMSVHASTKDPISASKNIILSSLSVKGEALPTVLLEEFSVTADQN